MSTFKVETYNEEASDPLTSLKGTEEMAFSTVEKAMGGPYSELLSCIQENQDSLYRLAYSYVKSRDTALDLVQEAVYRAWKTFGEKQGPEHAKSWLYKVLVNLCIDELRRERRTEPVDPGEMPEASSDPLKGQAAQMDLREALERLDPETKTVIVLRYFEDRKLFEIAELLGENLNSVKSRLYRGLKALRLDLEEVFDHE